MRVMCVTRKAKDLKQRDVYTVVNYSDKKYKILNDAGKYNWYMKKNFTEVQ